MELAEIEQELQDIQSQLSEICGAEEVYKDAIEKKRMDLKVSGTPAGEQILKLEGRISAQEERKREIREAIAAGKRAGSTAEKILSQLDDAEGWNTWDIIGGGGIITHMAKHSHLDEAQNLVQQLQSQLRRFKTELADIRINADLQVNIDGFLRFADYFFDGLFADWAVGDKISQSRSSVCGIIRQIDRMLDRLRDMEAAADRDIAASKARLDDLIVKS